jgi:hypothetical protein
MEKVQMYFSDVSSAPLPRNFMLQVKVFSRTSIYFTVETEEYYCI